MDKKSILGFVLIGVVLIGWMVYMSATQKPLEKQTVEAKKADTVQSMSEIKKPEMPGDSSNLQPAVPDSIQTAGKYGVFAPFADRKEEFINIETDLYKAKISSKGGTITYWQLKKYKKWDGEQVQLIRNQGGQLYLTFVSSEGKRIDTRALSYDLKGQERNIKISGDKTASIVLTLNIGNNRSIVKTITFVGNKYHIEHDFALENMDEIIPARGTMLNWANGLKYQEKNSVDESADALGMISMNGEVEELNASDDKKVETSATGIVDFAAIKTKYFTAAIIPQPWQKFDGTVDMSGYRKHYQKGGIAEYYDMSFRLPYKGGHQEYKFQIYMGPIDYNIVSAYGLHKTVNLGMKFIIRPIGEYFMLPIFNFIHKYVPNYGIAIILFSFLMKMLLYPLSIQQMRTSQRMKLLSPELNALKEKYKDDSTKQQQETMKLYSQYGLNPAGGCLPMVLQMPILFALWAVLRGSIDLRQSEFFWWIKDLSVPDQVVNFGFSFMGISHLSGLALLMGVTMYFQQKMTITDPRQKSMVIMMPVMFTLMFSNFPAGLNLYYFIFNLLAIAQQYYINNFSKNQPTLEEMRRAPKKEGWLQKKMREAQEMAAAQGKSVPGQKSLNSSQGSGKSTSKGSVRTNTNRKTPPKK